MKTEKITFDVNLKQIHVLGVDNSFKCINYGEIPDGEDVDVSQYTQLSPEEIAVINAYVGLCDKLRRQSRPMLEEPSAVGEPVYTLQSPCPADNTLIAKVYDINYSNDKKNKVIQIDVRVIHYNQSGVRVPEWDADTYIICDMTEHRKVEVPYSNPVEYEYSYVLAETFLQNGMSINQLMASAIQLAEFEPNSLFLQRVYGI